MRRMRPPRSAASRSVGAWRRWWPTSCTPRAASGVSCASATPSTRWASPSSCAPRTSPSSRPRRSSARASATSWAAATRSPATPSPPRSASSGRPTATTTSSRARHPVTRSRATSRRRRMRWRGSWGDLDTPAARALDQRGGSRVEAVQPAVPVGHPTVLDAGERLTQRQRDAVLHLGHPDAERVRLDLRDGRDDRRRAARERLDDLARLHAVAPLGDRDGTLLDRVAAVAPQLQDRVERDALEDRIRVGRDEAVVARDEHDVHAAELFEVLALLGVEEQHLLAAVLVGLLLGHEGCRVVAARLGLAHAAVPGARVA